MKLRLSIKEKLILSTSLVVVVSLSITGILLYVYFSSILFEKSVQDESAKLRQKALQVEYVFEDIKNFADNIILDEQIQNFDANSEIPEYFKVDKVIQRLLTLCNLRVYIRNSAIISGENVYWSEAVLDDYFKNKLKEKWYTDFTKTTSNREFTQVHTVYSRAESAEIPVFSYITDFKNLHSPDNITSKLVLNIDQGYITKIFNDGSEDFDDIICLNKQGYIYYQKTDNHQNVSRALDLYANKKYKGDTTYFEDGDGNITIGQSINNDLYLVNFVSKAKIFKKNNNIFILLALLLLISIGFIIIVNRPLVRGITRPLSKLTGLMEQISQGNLDVNVSITSGDEIEVLGNGFNKMVYELKENINKIIQHEESEKKLEMELLLMQINPHFIYNTLNTVIFLARKQKYEDIIQMMGSFIRVLQESVKLGQKEATTLVRCEKEIVDHYVCIQTLRYGDIFQVEWELDESVLECKIPKTIIQPLVENALFHGICPKDEKGTITVSVQKKNDDLYIKVSDTGVGFDDKIVNMVLQRNYTKNSTDSMAHIGLYNTNARIKSMYGEKYGVSISSTLGSGSTVTLHIPFVL